MKNWVFGRQIRVFVSTVMVMSLGGPVRSSILHVWCECARSLPPRPPTEKSSRHQLLFLVQHFFTRLDNHHRFRLGVVRCFCFPQTHRCHTCSVRCWFSSLRLNLNFHPRLISRFLWLSSSRSQDYLKVENELSRSVCGSWFNQEFTCYDVKTCHLKFTSLLHEVKFYIPSSGTEELNQLRSVCYWGNQRVRQLNYMSRNVSVVCLWGLSTKTTSSNQTHL